MAEISDEALQAYQALAANVRTYLRDQGFHAPETVAFHQRVRLEEPLAEIDRVVKENYRG